MSRPLSPFYPAIILFLFSSASLAQSKVINLTPSQQSQIQQAQQLMAKKHGQHTIDLSQPGNAKSRLPLLPIPTRMTTPKEFEHNLTNLKATLESMSESFFNKCRLESGALRESATDAAILHLYLSDTYAADLLAVEAAEKTSPTSTDYVQRINNLGAVLIESGHPEVAIPYLEYAETINPDNPSIQNNLGQAYTHLTLYGEATGHLQKALKKMPNHPLANLTLALINQSNAKAGHGNALTYAENSLKGGFTAHAWELAQHLDPNVRLATLVKDKVTTVEYIKDKEPPVPANCTSVATANTLRAQEEKFNQAVDKLRAYYDGVYNAKDKELGVPKSKAIEKMKQKQSEYQAMAANAKAGHFPSTAKLKSMTADAQSAVNVEYGFYDIAFSWFAFHMQYALQTDRGKDYFKREDISVTRIQQRKAEILDNLTGITDKIKLSDYPNEARMCQDVDYYVNIALAGYDKDLQLWRQARFDWDKEYFNRQLFWLFIATQDATEFEAKFSRLMSEYWDEMKTIASQNLYISPCYHSGEDKNGKIPEVNLETLKVEDFACPYTDLTAEGGNNSNLMVFNCHKANDIKADGTALTGGCGPGEKQPRYNGTLLIGLDGQLKNYLLIEDGFIGDNSIKWDREMNWDAATDEWWFNSGISYLK